MTNYVHLQDLNLENAFVIGLGLCVLEIEGSDLVCYDEFEMAVAKYPFELASRYRIYRGLPRDVGLNEMGHPVPWESDEDEDDFDDTPVEILQEYSYISTMNFTLVIRNEECC